MIKRAREEAIASKRTEYEKTYIKELMKKEKEDKTGKFKGHTEYKEKLKNAKNQCAENDTEFNTEEFNKSFDANFYQKFVPEFGKDFKDKKSGLLVKKKSTDLNDPVVIIDMISKLKTRFSINTKYILAAFMENVVCQLVNNAIFNCAAEKKKTIQVPFALQKSEGYAERMPLYRLFTILNATENFLSKKVDEEAETKEEAEAEPEAEQEPEPADADADGEEDEDKPRIMNFKTHVADICRFIKNKKALEFPEEVEFYQSINVGTGFKQYCSDIVVELLNTMAKMLASSVHERSIKTINEAFVYSCISNFYIIAKSDAEYPSVEKSIEEKIELCMKLNAENLAEKQKAKPPKKEAAK